MVRWVYVLMRLFRPNCSLGRPFQRGHRVKLSQHLDLVHSLFTSSNHRFKSSGLSIIQSPTQFSFPALLCTHHHKIKEGYNKAEGRGFSSAWKLWCWDPIHPTLAKAKEDGEEADYLTNIASHKDGEHAASSYAGCWYFVLGEVRSRMFEARLQIYSIVCGCHAEQINRCTE